LLLLLLTVDRQAFGNNLVHPRDTASQRLLPTGALTDVRDMNTNNDDDQQVI